MEYWGATFNLFDFYIASYLDIASMYREFVLKTDDCLDLRFVALTQLHAKSVLVLREIQALIEAGYPDGAMTRWRTLHELAVCSCVIFESKNPPNIIFCLKILRMLKVQSVIAIMLLN
nr:DUF5677 domain-containing protein [Ningiella sp. W23]